MLSDMADPDGKGWVMHSPASAGELQRITVGRQPGSSRRALLIGQVSNESLILAQNQRWRRA